LSTVGISVGVTSSGAPAGVLWAETAAMFLGRLEFFTIVIGLIRLFNDLPAMLSTPSSRRFRVGSRPSPSIAAIEDGVPAASGEGEEI